MTTQWSTRGLDSTQAGTGMDSSILDEHVVILMQGKNTFGDRIYSYLKVTLNDLKRMQFNASEGSPFNPSDYGTVIAAGQGEPTAEVVQEIESAYKVLSSGAQQAQAPVAPPPEEKGWDEF